MPPSRPEFLGSSSVGLLTVAMAAARSEAQETPGAPPAFGTSPPVGPAVAAETFAQAEKLVQVEMSPAERARAAGNWQQSLASLYERRTGPKKVAIEETIAPATVWNPAIAGKTTGPARDNVRGQCRCASASFTGRGHCVCAGHGACALELGRSKRRG